ncbi:hypothetical protein [Pediococcus pentosaceus]|uniref:hypothetical protein n=1 Tax=Pediococcus pentosaceus TaxID=1255 RepID=UPI00294BB668|nr:hypothetical protein [Pediococcus pentosaceus]MDV6381099.1 hypothetical protein [Pediococcus pentosaceus]
MSSIGQGSISIDDSTRIGQNAQDTANEVAGNVNNINSDNKLTPSEKLKLKQEYDKDVELYNIDIEQLKSINLPTVELETAMSNLTSFVTPLFKEMNRTSTVDRGTLNSVFTAFATADKNSSQAFVNMVQQVANDAKKAGDDAKEAGGKAQEVGEAAKQAASQAQADATQAATIASQATSAANNAFSQAQLVGSQASSAIAVQSAATAKAQSTADSAFSRAQTIGSQASSAIAVQSAATAKAQSTADSAFSRAKTAIDNGKVTSQAVTDLKDGSTLTIAELENGLASKVASSDFASYKTQTANQIGQMVTNSTFSAYQQTTADLISSKVATKDFNTYTSQTAKAISSKVESSDFNTYKTQTANLINDKVSSEDYTSDKKQTADMIDSKVSTTDFTTYQAQTDKLIGSKVANSDFSTYKTQTANLISSKVDNNQYQSDKTQTANLISQTVTDAVNDINVGGTNLIKNSKFDDKMNNWRIWCPQGMGTSTVQVNETGGGGDWPRQAIYLAKIINPEADKNNQFGIAQDNVPVEPSTEYVLQLFNDGSAPITVQHGSGTGDPFVSQVVSDHKVVWKFKTPADIYTTNIYIGFNSGQSGTAWISLTKLEKGNKATDWSLSPFDTATSTEIDQINNAIKLKADSSDVTSQINVAIKGVQTDVTNKVSSLTTQIDQTSDAIQFLAGTVGSRNLVYNATFEQMTNGFPTGWTKSGNTSNETGYFSNYPVSSYQGRPSIGVNTSKEMGWVMFAQSDPQPLPVDNSVDAINNVYSASMMVKVYGDGGAKPNGRVHVVLAFFDANKKRIESNIKGVWSKTATESNEQWHLVKVENLAPVASAKYVAIQALTYGVPTHTMVNQPMINIGATAQPFKPDMVNQASITESINNINLKVSNANGTSSQININNDTILLDANKIVFSGKTSLLDASIDTAKIANAAINTAQIADGAINNAKIANASIDDAKISNLNGNKIIAGSITANKINVDDLIANGINTKTLTSVNLNTSTLTTPQLDLGLNGTFTEDFDYTQPTSMFLPKKNKGTLTFNHGVLQSKGNMQTYVDGKWGGMNDNYTFQAGIDNSQWTEVAPGYIKLDLFKQNGADVGQRTYIDPTGYYYTSRNGIASYLGNVLQTPQVQTSSVLTKYIGPSDGELRLQIGNNGNHYGLQVGSYAGNEAVLSDFIYSSTTSGAPNVNITANGHLVRSTSASKYKYNIKNPDIETTLGDRLLNVHLATWNDKRAVDLYAEQLSTGEEREKSSIDKYYGLIAEQLRDAGLDMFISYGKNHEIEGIQYDRAWVPLLSVIRRLNDKVNEYELRLSKLEGVSK